LTTGVSDRLWEVSDIVALLEATEAKPGKRGSYKKEAAFFEHSMFVLQPLGG
jgi:hypothetical protein